MLGQNVEQLRELENVQKLDSLPVKVPLESGSRPLPALFAPLRWRNRGQGRRRPRRRGKRA